MRLYGLTRKGLFILVFLAFSVVALPTEAHGLLKDANPAPDVNLARAPRAISVTLTQPPMPNGKLTVRDGCGRVVSGASDVADDVISTDIASAQPGRWRVQFDFVSATDGHRYGDSYSFTVKGRRDCREEERAMDQEKEENEGEEEQEMGSDDRARDDMASDSQNDDHSGGQSVPVGGLVAASVIAFSTGLIARLRPRAG
jgi:methionine-rich copper-binding protein CopC